jgi:hypothetical protein
MMKKKKKNFKKLEKKVKKIMVKTLVINFLLHGNTEKN